MATWPVVSGQWPVQTQVILTLRAMAGRRCRSPSRTGQLTKINKNLLQRFPLATV